MKKKPTLKIQCQRCDRKKSISIMFCEKCCRDIKKQAQQELWEEIKEVILSWTGGNHKEAFEDFEEIKKKFGLE